MNDFASALFGRYGLKALASAAVLVVGIWVVAHYMAAPGGTVSVLWGLVEYTKANPQDVAQLATTATEPSSNRASLVVGKNETATPVPESGVLAHNLTATSAESLLLALRRQRGLRQLGALESNKPLNQMPPGTFGFAFSAWLEFGGLRRESSPLDARIQPFDQPTYFEVHRLGLGNDRIFLLAFCSESDASDLGLEPDGQDRQLVLSPEVWGSMTSLVSIPIERLKSADDRELQIDSQRRVQVLDVVIR